MMDTYGTTHIELQVGGYIPIPIRHMEKRPAVARWAEDAYTPPEGFATHGVGIRCGAGRHPIIGVDCDILDTTISEQMQAFILDRCGETICRVGRAPKCMLIYRGVQGMRKTTSARYEGVGVVEVLGAGQQFVAFGLHPDTKQPYTWPGMLGSILDVRAGDLPSISASDIQAIYAEFERLCAGRSATAPQPATIHADAYDPTDPLDRKKPIGLTLAEVKTLLHPLNPDCKREEWRNIGMAIYHEFSGSPEAFEVWDAWSAEGLTYAGSDLTAVQWSSFEGYTGRPLTAAYLLKVAKKTTPPTAPVASGDFFRDLQWSPSRFVDAPPPIPMVIEGFMPRGIVALMYSAGGVGKSTLSLSMSVRIAVASKYATTFLNYAVNGGRVVIVTAEDPDLILNRRYISIVQQLADELDVTLHALRADIEENLSIVSTFGKAVQLFRLGVDGSISCTDFYTSLSACLGEMEGLQLVIIDTKTRYSPGEGGGNVTATQEVSFYEGIALHTGASVMLMHHTNKASRNGSQTGAQAYRDASGLFDAARACWFLQPLKKDQMSGLDEEERKKYLCLENAKNNYLAMSDDIILLREGFEYTVQSNTPKISREVKKERLRQEAYDVVLRIVQEADGETHTAAVLRVGKGSYNISRDRITSALTDAVEDGLLYKGANSIGCSILYSLTDDGVQYLETV